MRFGEFLNENLTLAPWMISDRDRIHAYMENLRGLGENDIKSYTIHDDLTVSVEGTVVLTDSADVLGKALMNGRTGNVIPVQFNEITHAFMAHRVDLVSMIGCPRRIGRYLNIQDNMITDLEGMPEEVTNVFLAGNPIDSLSGIHKRWKRSHSGRFRIPHTVESSVLGLLKIEGLEGIELGLTAFKGLPIVSMVKIINRHLAGDRDLLECQLELVQAGLKEYAKL